MEGFEGFDWYADEYKLPVKGDSAVSLWQSYSTTSPIANTVGKVKETASDFGGLIAAPFKAVIAVPGKVLDYATGTVKSTYLYLVGGIVLIGILAIVLLGAGTKFMGTVQK